MQRQTSGPKYPRLESQEMKTKESSQAVGNYLVQNKIGEGAYGSIFKCRSLIDSATYVIKQVKISIDGGGVNESMNEVAIIKRLRHKNIVRYVDSFS